MAKETMSISGGPTEESIAQVGSDNYKELGRAECEAFRQQLRRVFGEEPDGASLAIKIYPHDSGSYYEVSVMFDPSIEEARKYAYKLEGETPEYWDDEALAYLEKRGFPTESQRDQSERDQSERN